MITWMIPLLVFLLAGRSLLMAQEEGDTSMDDFLWGPEKVLVTATREAEHPFDAPATVVTITEQMIRERGYRDLKDILNDIPGFDLSTNVYGEFSTLAAQRGNSGNNKLVFMLDGEEITSPDGGKFPLGYNVPVSMAKRVEIVYGPASALYGPDAFGVVNIITHDAEQIDGLDLDAAGGSFSSSDVSVNMGKAVSENVQFKVFGRFYRSDGQDLSDRYPELGFIRRYPAPLNNRMEAPIRDWNLTAGLKVHSLSLSFYNSSFHEQLSNGLDPAQYVYNREAYWGQRITGVSLSHEYEAGRFHLTSHAAFNVFEINPDMNWYYLIPPEGPDEDYSTLKVHQYGKTNGTKFDFHARYSASDRVGLSAGFSYEDITGLGTGDVYGQPFKPDDPLYLDNYGIVQAVVSSQNYGVYGQAKIRLNGSLSAFTGLRVDYNTIYHSTVNPRVGLVFNHSDNQSFKLIYGSAFIAPSYFHRFETWFVAEYGHIQNPGLKPETMKSLEFNWSRSWLRQLQSSVSVFNNWVDDLIVRRNYGYIAMSDPFVDADGDGQVFVEWNDNFGKLISRGVDLRLDYVRSHDLKVHLNYSYLDGHNTDPNTGEQLDLFKTSKHKAMAGFTWYPLENLSLTPSLRWVGRIATQRENSLYAGRRMPGYCLVNLHARLYDLWPQVELFVTVNNLLDRHYHTSGVGSESSVYLPQVPQNLRSVMLGISYSPSF